MNIKDKKAKALMILCPWFPQLISISDKAITTVVYKVYFLNVVRLFSG